jgi:Tfp pilus assembly protein PilF
VNAFRQLTTERLHRQSKLLALLAIVMLSAIAYVNSLTNGFHFDDIEGIVRNPTIRDLRNIPSYFTEVSKFRLVSGRDWRPVVMATYALNYATSGLNPMTFHVTNVLIHIGTAWLIFLIMEEILRRRASKLPAALSIPPFLLAVIPAALFAVHTVNSEAVNYIWARSSLLAAFFNLLAFYFFLQGPLNEHKEKTAGWHLAGLVSFILGLGAKATVVTLPATLVLYETVFLNPLSHNLLKLFWKEPKRITKYLPIAAVCLAYIVFRFVYLRGFFRRVISSTADVSATAYLLTQFRAWVYYIKLFFWPHPLITDYPGFGWSQSLWDLSVLLSLIIIVTALVLAWRMRRSDPALTFFAFWFFITLLPEASFIPLFDAVTGYRPYLANVGLSVVATLLSIKGATWIWNRTPKNDVKSKSKFGLAYGLFFGVVLCVLAAATIVRNRAWKDEMSLWSDVVSKDPTNPRAYVNLALQFIRTGNYQEAQRLSEKAVEHGPKRGSPYMLRGYLAFLLDRNDLALSDLTNAIHLDPRVPTPFYYRGEVYRKMRDYDRALTDYQSALALLPFYTDAYLGMALVHMDKGEREQAMASCNKITEIDRDDARGYNCLGILLLEQNRIPEALQIYQRGVIHVPQDSGLWYGLGLAYEQNRMYREAGDAFERASKLTR